MYLRTNLSESEDHNTESAKKRGVVIAGIKTQRKAATLTNFILAVGLIFISVAAIGILRNMSIKQASELERDYTVVIAEQLKETIEKAASYPANSEDTLELKDPIIYSFNISQNRINFHFDKTGLDKVVYFFSPGVNVIPSSFETSGIIHIYKRDNNIYVTNELICNLTDSICDPGCIAIGKCDSACYNESMHDVCNPYCLDRNGDGKVDANDKDIICDPDCYSTFQKGFYDIDCITPADTICDPDTNNIKDGICDSDCLGTNGVCDPDCAQYDPDCPHKGNNVCEPERGESCLDYPKYNDCNCTAGKTCKTDCSAFNSSLFDEKGCIDSSNIKDKGEPCKDNCQCSKVGGLICDKRFGSNMCCLQNEYYNYTLSACINYMKDNQCRISEPFLENCINSQKDCNCTTLNLGDCCLRCKNSTDNGCCEAGKKKCEKSTGPECIPPGAVPEKGTCECDAECNPDPALKLKCSAKKDEPNNKACCPAETEWNGNECKETTKLRVVVIPINWELGADNFKSKADALLDYYVERIPLRECKSSLKKLIPDGVTNYGAHWQGGSCSIPNDGGPNCYSSSGALYTIYFCAQEYSQATGEFYDFAAGIDSHDIAEEDCNYNVGGWSDGYGGLPVVIAESSALGIVTHELGHEFNLADQYCDCTGAYSKYCGFNAPINPLRADLGCSESTCCYTSFGTGPYYSPSCRWCYGNVDMRGTGERTSMSNRILFGEKGYYSQPEYDYMKNNPKMQCG